MAASEIQHRNIIVIPRDIYQKCTEVMPIPKPRLLRGRDPSTRKRLLNAPDRDTPPPPRPTQGYAQHHNGVLTASSPAATRQTINDIIAEPSHTSISFPSSPSLTSSLSSFSSSSSSSSSSSISPSSFEVSPISGSSIHGNVCKYGQGNNSAVTIGGHIATIHLHNLSSVSSKKRKLAPVPTKNNNNSEVPSSSQQPSTKKLKVDPIQKTKTRRSPSPKKNTATKEVIVISSDDDDEEDRSVITNTTCVATATTTTTTTMTAIQSPAADGHHKYDLDPAFRRVVDSIFPSFESHNKATLERAYATSRILRENYIITRYLGSGASGFVLAAKRVFDGREVAIKVIPHTGDHVEQKVQRELGILLRLKEHENVLSFLEHFTSSLYGDVDPDDQSNKDISYIVTEMAGFSLFDFIELHKPVQDEDASTRSKNIQELPRSATSPPSIYSSAIQEDALRSIFTQLALALHSLHSQSIVHGDVKDENALISIDRSTNTYRAKLCDFGHSKYLQPGSSPCFSFYGTTILAPPEMDSNVAARQKSKEQQLGNRRAAATAGNNSQPTTWDLFYGFEADVWALGLTLFTMIHGDLPKELYETEKKKLAAYKRKRASHRMFPFTLQDNIDPDLKDLLKNMLAVDPTRRLTMSEVINHRWMRRRPQ